LLQALGKGLLPRHSPGRRGLTDLQFDLSLPAAMVAAGELRIRREEIAAYF
jgi:hypothetical protein